jgi:hypothetical protein
VKIMDMPKLESPFIRKEINGVYVVTPEINPEYKWVFEDEAVMAIEKLHGTNVSIVIENGVVSSIWNRTARIPFINSGKRFIIDAILNSNERGHLDLLDDGQHFGEVIGEKVNGNPYNIKGNLWIPFETYCQKHLRYKSWGKYPKTYEGISTWFKDLMPLFWMMQHEGDKTGFVEGIVFTHPNGKMAKLRRDMFDWYKGQRHKEEAVC